MMKVLIHSDIHLELGSFEVPTDIESDIAILPGDIAVPGVKAVHWAVRTSMFNDSYQRKRIVRVSPGIGE